MFDDEENKNSGTAASLWSRRSEGWRNLYVRFNLNTVGLFIYKKLQKHILYVHWIVNGNQKLFIQREINIGISSDELNELRKQWECVRGLCLDRFHQGRASLHLGPAHRAGLLLLQPLQDTHLAEGVVAVQRHWGVGVVEADRALAGAFLLAAQFLFSAVVPVLLQ